MNAVSTFTEISTRRPSQRLPMMHLTIALTLMALVVRGVGISLRPFWLDEAFSDWFSQQSFRYLWTVLPTYEAHPPLYYSLLKLWRHVFGGDPVAVRSLSLLFSVLTVPLIMTIAREQEREASTGQALLRAGVAGFLTACAPMLVYVGQEARPYPMLAFAYGSAILGVTRLARQFRSGEAGSWKGWLLLGLATELTLWSHSLGLLYTVCLALSLLPFMLVRPFSGARWMRASVTGALVLAIYLPCLALVMKRAHDWGTNWLHWDPSMLLQLLVLYTVPVEALTIGSAIAALAMALLIKRALASTYISKGWSSDRLLLLLWLGPPLLAALISALFVPVFLARTLTGTLVPLYLLIAGTIARSDSLQERRWIPAAICITLLPTAIVISIRPPSEQWDRVADALQANVRQNDQIWFYPADSALPLGSLHRAFKGLKRPIPEPFPTLNFEGPIRAGWPATVSLTPAQAAGFANDPTLKTVPVIWLVTRQREIFDPDSDLPKALAHVRRAGLKQEWGYIGIQPYYRR